MDRFDHLLRCHVVKVSARDGQGRVAELAADEVDGDALSHQLKGMGVAEAVGVDPLFQASLFPQPLEKRSHVGAPEGFSFQGAKEGVAAVEPQLFSPVQPPSKPGDRPGVETDNAGPVAFSMEDPDRPGVQVHVFRFQVEGLLAPETGPPKKDDQGRVSDAGRSLLATGLQEGERLLFGERFRRTLRSRFSVVFGHNRHYKARRGEGKNKNDTKAASFEKTLQENDPTSGLGHDPTGAYHEEGGFLEVVEEFGAWVSWVRLENCEVR